MKLIDRSLGRLVELQEMNRDSKECETKRRDCEAEDHKKRGVASGLRENCGISFEC